MPASRPAKPEFVGLHVRVPKVLFDKLIARRDALRKTNPMLNLSEAVRTLLEESMKEKR